MKKFAITTISLLLLLTLGSCNSQKSNTSNSSKAETSSKTKNKSPQSDNSTQSTSSQQSQSTQSSQQSKIVDTKNLYEYYFGNYDYVKILDKGDTLVNLKSEYGKEYNIKSDISIKKYLKKTISKDDLRYEYKGKKNIQKGTKKGDKIGTLYISYNDEILDTINITSPEDIKFDFNKMTVYKQDKQVMLTSLELKILQLLFNNLNKVVTRDYLIESIWNWTGNDVNDNTITVYLKRIREKIGNDIIKTIKGIGYIIDEEN